MVSHQFYCDQSILHLRALLNLWSVVLTIEDLIVFFLMIHSQFFLASFLPFFSPTIFSLSSTFYLLPIHATGNVLASALQKTWKWNID